MKIILASTSPRRHQLLKDTGFTFEILAPTSEELEHAGESPKKMVARLSDEKAYNVSERVKTELGSAIIIAADTTVVTPDGKKVLGKPVNKAHAEKILKLISGRTHRVFTAFTILEMNRGKIKKVLTHVVETKVKMRKLTPLQIKNYVLSGEPMDKAGAYGAQGIGMCLIESIQGSYSNVVGLPMAELTEDLKKEFKVHPHWDSKN